MPSLHGMKHANRPSAAAANPSAGRSQYALPFDTTHSAFEPASAHSRFTNATIAPPYPRRSSSLSTASSSSSDHASLREVAAGT